MKALKLDGQGKVRIVEAPEPTPGPGQVAIRTRMSALCGSEMGRFRGAGMGKGNSGHEGMGIVSRAGEGVTRVRVGDRVGVSAIAGCGRPECERCRAGQSTWCPDRKFYGSMHAEQFLAAEMGCLPLPEDVADDVGALITGDGLGVPYHTSLKLAGDDIRTIAVFGLGPIGLGSVLLQAWLGRRIIAVDLSAERLALAGNLGAALTVDAGAQDPVEAIKAATDGQGADACLEAAGVPQTARQCFKAVRTAGLVAFNGEQKSVELSPSEDFIRRDVRAVGSWFFQVGEYPEMLRLYRDGLPVKSLVTHVFPFERAQEAFDSFAAGATGKVLLRYEAR
ncbi:MAG: zinc-binding dehydrogenase [Candidatus Sumerlaeota bacterium]|nr:zinc-binding dehydrogenase [Candidatus Sumerlaeota bacterium]